MFTEFFASRSSCPSPSLMQGEKSTHKSTLNLHLSCAHNLQNTVRVESKRFSFEVSPFGFQSKFHHLSTAQHWSWYIITLKLGILKEMLCGIEIYRPPNQNHYLIHVRNYYNFITIYIYLLPTVNNY